MDLLSQFHVRKRATLSGEYAHTSMMAGFNDRSVTLDAPEQLADMGAVLGSRTRLAVLGVLVRASEPLNINELARRVGVDASPVRTHLELLLKAGLIREVGSPSGRERRFETSLTGIGLVLHDVHKPKADGKDLPRAAQRVQKKLDALAKEAAKLDAKGRKLAEELRRALASAEKARG